MGVDAKKGILACEEETVNLHRCKNWSFPISQALPVIRSQLLLRYRITIYCSALLWRALQL